MINFLKTWCENIVVIIVICIIIEIILPEGKNKKYVQVIIGIYIIFTILNPIINNLLDLENVNLKEILGYENTIETSLNYNNKNIEKIYIDAMENEIKKEINLLGFDVKKIRIETSLNYEKIEKIRIELKEEKIKTNEIKVEIKENKKEISSEEKEKIVDKILELYEVEKDKILIF